MEDEIIKECKECGKDFVTRNKRKVFCSGACKVKNSKKNNIKDYNHVCLFCGNEFISQSQKTKYCSFSCSGKAKNLNFDGFFKCKECGKGFKQKHSKNFYCSEKCKSAYNDRNKPLVVVECSNCNKEISVPRKKEGKQINFFCSKQCEGDFRSNKAKDTRICESCGGEFICRKGDSIRFCSIFCQSNWQKTIIGKSHPSYRHDITDDMRIKKCETCGKDIFGTPKEFEIKKYCSRKCMRVSQKHSMTRPHQIIVDILERMELVFEIEKTVSRFALDCFIPLKNIGIEVMGDYWHCNSEIYDTPDKIQENAIKRDKRKNTFLLAQGYKILYLWEKDIIQNKKLCEKMIDEFIKSNGMLENYHSTNYFLSGNKLILNKEIKKQYFE